MKPTDLYEFHKKNVKLTAIDGKTYEGFAIWVDADEFEKEPESLEIEENVFYLEDIREISIEK
ncbi:MAG: hypothetical protein ACRCZC_07160 [Culicoidibacterales bacterium]